MAEAIQNALEGLPKELIVFIISMCPILELRGGLIAASAMGINVWVALPICIAGNLLPIPFILLLIRKIFTLMKKTKFFGKIADKLEKKAEKNKGKVNKYAMWGLFALVAIPLPGTGAWTGALVADALDLRIKKSFPMIAFGVLTAGVIMVVIAYLFPAVFEKLFI